MGTGLARSGHHHFAICETPSCGSHAIRHDFDPAFHYPALRSAEIAGDRRGAYGCPCHRHRARPALTGAILACGVLLALIVGFGPVLQAIPLNLVQLLVGALLLLFGMRWLRKATLRSAGVIPLHDDK